MALEATHIRLALDLKDKYGVQNVERYVAGSRMRLELWIGWI